MVEVVGNIRRRKDLVDNVELLIVPKGVLLFDLMNKIVEMGSNDGMKIADSKTIMMRSGDDKIPAKLWFVDINQWPIMLLVKTGGNKTNKRIAKLCELRGWRLLVNKGCIVNSVNERLPIKEEEDIFRLLEIPYLKPNERE